MPSEREQRALIGARDRAALARARLRDPRVPVPDERSIESLAAVLVGMRVGSHTMTPAVARDVADYAMRWALEGTTPGGAPG